MICPNCHNDQSVTEQNYGALYTCKACQAVYFLNFDGQPLFDDQIQTDTLPDELNEPPQLAPEPLCETAANSSIDFNEPLTSFETNSAPVEVASAFSEVAKDISDYGNTETQIAHLNYDLRIKGLDTAEMMALLKEAIEDSRFGWDANELMRTIKHGELQFLQLNPVKAYILAKRLQFMDVEKIWKQNAVG